MPIQSEQSSTEPNRRSSDLAPLVRQLEQRLIRSPPLHRAAATGDCGALLRLVQRGADPSLSSSVLDGNTPLHCAAAFGQTAAAYYLARLGADVNIQGQCALSPLGMAARAGHGDVVQVLLFWQACLLGDRMLVAAAYHNCGAAVATLLINRGALLQCMQEEKDRLLIQACQNDDAGLVIAFLKAGSNPLCCTQDGGGRSLLSLKGHNKCSPMVLRLLFEHLLSITEPMTPSPLKGMSVVQQRYHRRSRSL